MQLCKFKKRWQEYTELYKKELHDSNRVHQKENLRHSGASLVVQWIRIRLPMQETQVRSLVQKAPACHGVTKPMHYNY